MSKLLEFQKWSIFNAFSFSFSSIIWWPKENRDFLEQSGWKDFMLSFGNLDMLSGEVIMFPIVVNGEMFIRFTDTNPLSSIFKAKYFGQYNVIQVELVDSKNGGYDYIWPENITMMSIGEYYKTQGRLPSDTELIRITSLPVWGIDIRVVITTDPSGMIKMVAIPSFHSDSRQYLPAASVFGSILHEIASNHFPDVPSAVQYGNDIYKGFNDILTANNFHIKLPQYLLPEPSQSNLDAAKRIIGRQGLHPEGIETEIIMALASRGLLEDRPDLSMSRYMKLYVDNIREIGGYLRYPYALIRSIEAPLINLNSYQSEYKLQSDSVGPLSKYALMLQSVNLNLANVGRATLSSFHPSILRRLDATYGHRINQILKGVIPGTQNFVRFDNNFKAIILATGEEGNYRRRSDPVAKLPHQIAGIRDIFREFEIGIDPYDIVLPEARKPRLSIHGVTFKTQDLLRILFNTPIVGAIAFGIDEYDPLWLSTRDVRLIQELLSGRLMIRTYITELSNDAFLHLSSRETLIHLYRVLGKNAVLLDRAFVLGEPLADQFSKLKENVKDDAVGGLSTLLSVF